MKYLITIFLTFCTIICFAQTTLSEKDFNNLIALGQLYSKNNMANGDAFKKSADSLQTPVLAPIIETLIAIGKGDTSLLQHQFLKRPKNDELKLWYVLREIHYNNSSEKKKPRSAAEVAKETLEADINVYWLVDNYYYRLSSGLGMMFNDADINTKDINITQLGLKDTTEQSVAFLNIINGLIHGRLRVLNYMKNASRISMYLSHMPTFNGKPYYEYTSLNKNDFDWIGYEKKESFNTRHIGNFLEILLIHLNTATSLKDKSATHDIYWKSILSKPDYFKYSSEKDGLYAFYNKASK